MAEREKVIKGLECCISEYTCRGCPYRGEGECEDGGYYYSKAIEDALALLREQEPVEPHVERDSDGDSWYYGCGACHEAIDYKDKFCRHCGREVKWE